MLDSLRAFSRTWVAKIFFGILILSFAAFGISNVITDLGTTTVARVGEEEITVREYQRAYQLQLNQAAQQIGMVPTTDQAVALGIPGSVLGQLASDAAINQISLKLGLGVSDERLGKMLREDPTFGGVLTQFERANFLRALQENGYTEAEYFALQNRAARRQQLAAGLFADAAVPTAATELVTRYTGDTRTIEYFVLNATNTLPVAEPTDADLTLYLTEHQAEYRTSETRTAEVMLLSPEVLAEGKTIADDVIAAEYERTKSTLGVQERRTIQQVVLTPEAATIFEAGKASGKTFADLVAEAGLNITELGTFAKSEVVDSALANASFGLAAGDFAIIPGAGGKRAVSVSTIEPGGTPELEEVRDTIAKNLAVAEARKEYLDILDQVEELRAAFQPLGQIAERFKLPVAKVVVGTSGDELAAIAQLPQEDRGRVASAIFAAAQDKLASTVALSASRNAWFDLKSVEPARDRTLEEARTELAAAWTAEKTDEALAAEAAKVEERLRSGEKLAEVAVALNQFPSLSQPMSRQGDGTPLIDQTVAAAAFAGGPGHFGSARNADGDYVLFQVVDITESPANPQAADFVAEATRDTLFSDFVAGIRQEYGVRENRAVLSQILALDPSGQ